MYYFYYLMCPKTREQHLKKYKKLNIPIPEYLNENKLINFINIVNKNEASKLTKNINKKYINQKYLLFLQNVSENKIEMFKNNHNHYFLTYFLIIFILLIFINLFCNKLNKSS